MKSGLDAIPLFLLDDLLMRKLFQGFKDSKKNSFHRNYLRK